MMHRNGLYIVATPIGNLADFTHRAVDVLGSADLILAEDTRHSRVLLDRYGIKGKVQALHEHNEDARIPELLEQLRQGRMLALISDAGTPLVSDPGFRLVRAAAEAGIPVVPIPGPSALTAALAVAGIATDRFVFEGFLPARATARLKTLQRLSQETRTLVFFESSHRVRDFLADCERAFGPERKAAVCRELTKQYETVLRGSLGALREILDRDSDQTRGEFVVVVAGSDLPQGQVAGLELARALLEHLPASQAARVAAKITGESRRDLYAAISATPDGAASEAPARASENLS